MHTLRIAYFGTPDFSQKLLSQIVEDKDLQAEVVFVVTQPDTKVGRKQVVTPSPVKIYAQAHNIPVYTQLNDEVKEKLKDIDLAFLFAYGELLPRELLEAPRYGFWNLHPSLLPLYRGPSPVASALLAGDIETGVSIMKMDRELDHGPIVAQEKAYIFPMWRRDQLTTHLVDLGFKLLKQLLLRYGNDLSQTPMIEQDHANATYTKRLKKEDGYLPWHIILSCEGQRMDTKLGGDGGPLSVQEVFNRFRGLYDWPGLWTMIEKDGRQMRLKIPKVHLENEKFVIKSVQLEGKNKQTLAQFKQGNPSLFIR